MMDQTVLLPDLVGRFPSEAAEDPPFFRWQDNGCWYPIDPPSTVKVLSRILDYIGHPRIRDLCRRAGDKLAEQYSWKNTAKKFFEPYK
jgi:glycosyltransferase involved in cell wall biosynthesis